MPRGHVNSISLAAATFAWWPRQDLNADRPLAVEQHAQVACSALCKACEHTCAQQAAHMAPTNALLPLLTHAKTIVEGIADKAAKESVEDAVQQLKSVAFAITSAGRHNRDVTIEEERALWELVCLLWVCILQRLHSATPTNMLQQLLPLQKRNQHLAITASRRTRRGAFSRLTLLLRAEHLRGFC